MKLNHYIWSIIALLLTGRHSVAAVNGNTPDGVHHDPDGGITYKAKVAITEAHTLVKHSTGTNREVEPCVAATDEPFGFATDRSEAGDDVNVDGFGMASRTRFGVAADAITPGQRVYTDANGRLTNTSTAGSWLVGRALESAAQAGLPFEVEPCFPVEQ